MQRQIVAALASGLGLTALFWSGVTRAEPYIAVQQGLMCGQCHVNPTGGGLRSALGNVMAQTQLAAHGMPAGAPAWSGQLTDYFAAGGDLRAAAIWSQTQGASAASTLSLEQFRAYLGVSVLPDRLLLYLDEQLAPDTSVNREAWVMYRPASRSWYLKAGRLYLPFGLRLQDQQAFTRQVAGVNMDTPDNGAELGYANATWDAQLALSGGAAGGTTPGNGRQYTAQVARVLSRWRVGVGANRNDATALRSSAGALFAGMRTGAVAWLAELDLVQAARPSGPDGRFAVALLELDWRCAPGANLKLTSEWLDPDRRRHGNLSQRNSLLFEYTPLPYLQLRAGWRHVSSAPGGVLPDSQRAFIELHAYF